MGLQEKPSSLLNPLEEPGWNDLLKSQPGASFFHTAEWAQTLSASYGHKPLYFAQLENGKLKGLLGVMEINSFITGKRGVSLPFTDYCGLLSTDYHTAANLYMEAIGYGRKRGWKSYELRGGTGLPEKREVDATFYMHEIPLAANPETVFQGCKSSVRTAIRKAESANIKVEFSESPEGMKIFYQLHCKTREKHGVPPQPFHFFANICKHVFKSRLGFVAIARAEGQPVAAAVFLHFGTSAIYKFGASDERFQDVRPTNLIFAEVIKHYCREGFSGLNLGRTSLDNEGLRRFKAGWGAVEKKLGYCKYDFRRECYSPAKDKASGWHTSIFSRMPSRLSRVCGELLYKHIS